MRIIYVESYGDDELGDADAFYEVVDDKIQLITAWSNNDADYRQEYMTPLFRHLGIDIKPLPKKYRKQARLLLCKAWGN